MKIVLGIALASIECTTQSSEPGKATAYEIILDEEAALQPSPC